MGLKAELACSKEKDIFGSPQIALCTLHASFMSPSNLGARLTMCTKSVLSYIYQKTFTDLHNAHHVRLGNHSAIKSCLVFGRETDSTTGLTLTVSIIGHGLACHQEEARETVNHGYKKRNVKELDEKMQSVLTCKLETLFVIPDIDLRTFGCHNLNLCSE